MDYYKCEWCGGRSNYPLMNGFCSPKCAAEAKGAKAASDAQSTQTAAGLAGLLVLVVMLAGAILRGLGWGARWIAKCEEKFPFAPWYSSLLEKVAWNPLRKLGLPGENRLLRAACHFLIWYALGFIWIPIAYYIAAAKAPSPLDSPQHECRPVGFAERERDKTKDQPTFTDVRENS